VKTVRVVKAYESTANIEPLPGTRDWMDRLPDKHGYMCFPVSLTNRLGWGISFPDDISFIWDGVDDPTPNHVTILKGEQWANPNRGSATVSFDTGLIFHTDSDTTTLTMPVPNQFIAGTQSFTTLISTSFYRAPLPIAWKITEANKEITIPAGTPVAAILPLSLGHLENNYVLEVDNTQPPPEYWEELNKYGQAAQEKNSKGDWSKMYRNAVNYDGTSLGNHETKSIKLKTVTCPVTGATIEATD
jgi:hypothetical protein